MRSKLNCENNDNSQNLICPFRQQFKWIGFLNRNIFRDNQLTIRLKRIRQTYSSKKRSPWGEVNFLYGFCFTLQSTFGIELCVYKVNYLVIFVTTFPTACQQEE